MTPGAQAPAAGPDASLTRVLRGCVDRVNAGTPMLLLFTGEPGPVREAVAAVAADAPVGRGARVVTVAPADGVRYDPVDVLARSWKRGTRRVSLDDRQRDVAWNWIGLVPFWGNLVAAIYETVAALRRNDPARDPALMPLLRAHRQRTLIAALFDLHTADRAAAARLCAALAHATPGSRLLVVGGASDSQGARPPILELCRQLPPDRLVLQPIAQHHAALDRLAARSPEAARALRAAATLGLEFDGTTLARHLGIDELAAEDRLAVAAGAGLIRIVGTRDLPGAEIATVYRFESQALRDTIVTAAPASAGAPDADTIRRSQPPG